MQGNADTQGSGTSFLASSWPQLIIGIVCMASVANLQYGWTLFVNPIDAKYHWGRPDIQIAFTTFVLIETWLIPVEGYLVDRFGPRWVVMGGGILVALAWWVNSWADNLATLYVAAAIGGIGVGCVYGTCVGNALKWFPGRRGLAAGLTAAGFGAGAAVTIVPIGKMIEASGYEHTFLFFGMLQGAIVVVMSMLMIKAPANLKAKTAAAARHTSPRGDCTPAQVLGNPIFYVLYVMFVLIAAGGLTMAANIALVAKDFKIDKTPVEVLFWTGPALATALAMNRVFDGVGRPFFGWVSDRIGRENTMFIAFAIGAVALYAMTQVGTDPVSFVLITAVYFGVYGEIFSLFPATQGDTFGSKYAAANAGMLYTAKGTAAFMVPLGAYLAKQQGWNTVFMVFVACNIVAALLALFVLKPMRARWYAGAAGQGQGAGSVTADAR